MPLIEQFNGNVLLQALRAGREDGAAAAKAKAAQEASERYTGLMGQFMGGQDSGVQTGGGVAAQYAPSRPAKPPTMGEAFNPGAMGQIEAMDAGGAAPMAAPQQAPQAPARQPRQLDMAVLGQMMALDPETTGRLITSMKAMDEMTLKRHETRNTTLGAAAQWLSRYPAEQRGQLLQTLMPQLEQAGWSREEIAQADMSDASLGGYQNMAMAMDDIIDNTLAEREFQAGKNIAVVPGGSVANVRPDGSASYVIGGGGVPGGAAPVQVKSIAEAKQLAPGTRFIDPNGVERVVPGGAGGNASGGFPG